VASDLQHKRKTFGDLRKRFNNTSDE